MRGTGNCFEVLSRANSREFSICMSEGRRIDAF